MCEVSVHPSSDTIAKLCLEKYENLPKTGKPKDNEWTVLAGIVLTNSKLSTNEVVAIGVGTKCIGEQKLCSQGFILNDSHAEVLARRSLMRFLYYEISKALENKNSIFLWDENEKTCRIKEEITFHFFCTHTPCGDACIIEEDQEPLIKKQKLSISTNHEVGYELESKPSTEIIYTGAKLINYVSEDKMLQVKGVLRTKPGRGDRSLSMSCSDKIAKWCLLGVQGALLDLYVAKPIYFASLNFCSTKESNQLESLSRAFYKRWDENLNHYRSQKYNRNCAEIRICDENLQFQYAKTETKQASPCVLYWSKLPEELRPHEVSVNGKRLGIIKKALNTPQAALKISKFNLMQTFVQLAETQPEFLDSLGLDAKQIQSTSYALLKSKATSYQDAWSLAKKHYFGFWVEKPKSLVEFSIQSVLGCFEK